MMPVEAGASVYLLTITLFAADYQWSWPCQHGVPMRGSLGGPPGRLGTAFSWLWKRLCPLHSLEEAHLLLSMLRSHNYTKRNRKKGGEKEVCEEPSMNFSCLDNQEVSLSRQGLILAVNGCVE